MNFTFVNETKKQVIDLGDLDTAGYSFYFLLRHAVADKDRVAVLSDEYVHCDDLAKKGYAHADISSIEKASFSLFCDALTLDSRADFSRLFIKLFSDYFWVFPEYFEPKFMRDAWNDLTSVVKRYKCISSLIVSEKGLFDTLLTDVEFLLKDLVQIQHDEISQRELLQDMDEIANKYGFDLRDLRD